jgi:FkbM family methyltransferase
MNTQSRARRILSRTSGLTTLKLLLASLRQTRPWARPAADALLACLKRNDRIYLKYTVNGCKRKVFLRMAHLDSDFQTALELAVEDRYRMEQLPEPDLILDGGSNTGLFALSAAAWWPKVRILAFEPVPDNAAVVKEHVAMNGLNDVVIVRELALSDCEGSINFYERDANQGSFDSELPWLSMRTVERKSLRELLKEQTFSKVLIKLDIEGAEREVLDDLFAQNFEGEVVIVMELHDVARNLQFMKELAARNQLMMDVYQLDEHTGHCQMTSAGWENSRN